MVAFTLPPFRALLRAAVAIASLAAVQAQDDVSEETIILQLPLPTAVSAAAPAAASTDTTPAAAKTPEEKRLAELLKLKFERNMAAIVEAQAAPPEAAPADDAQRIARFERDVVAGRWREAGAYLRTLPKEDGAKVYEYLLRQLDRAPSIAKPGQPQQQNQQGPALAPTLQVQEIADIVDMAPADLTPEQVKLVAAVLRRVLAANAFLQPLLTRLEAGSERLGGNEPAKRERAGLLLLEAGRPAEALQFLPPLSNGRGIASLDLLEKHVRATFQLGRDKSDPQLVLRGWQLNQLILAEPGCPPEHRARAWARFVEYVRHLPAEDRVAALRQAMTQEPAQLAALVRVLAARLTEDRSNRDIAIRKANLDALHDLAEALAAAPARSSLSPLVLDLFANHWVEEAEYAARMYQPPRPQQVQYDEFGNRVFYNSGAVISQNANQLPAVPAPDVARTAPKATWIAALSPALQVRTLAATAELHLKLEADREALPAVEVLAQLDPTQAQRLANQLLRTWASTHDPQRNVAQRTSGLVIYQSSGVMMQQGIPLTRALQQRNLDELSAVVGRLRVLPIEALDDSALVGAFTAAHSGAEVFRREAIQQVFGDVAKMDLGTLAELLQTMRQRLATQWRRPNIQQQAKTQRTDAQVEAEVLRGYELLGGLIDSALERRSEDWRIHLAHAATNFDLAEFQYGRKVDLAIYVEKRESAFASFRRAAALYAQALPTLARDKHSPLTFHLWLNANLGASDLALVTRQQEASEKDLQEIRGAMLALPEGAGERHLDLLAEAITGSLGSLPAHLKPRYLRAAAAIVQTRPSAEKIHELVSYYDGLLREIELSTRIDGEPAVGHEEPFGVFLTLRHTADLERESAGGFGKYLRNLSKGNMGYYPSGAMPPVDHRDEMEKQLREKFSEGFDVLSITFHDEKVQSRGYGRDGWRETPLAYVLLKAKDGAVDRLPSVRLDVDFLDASGPVVLPVEAPVLLLDARATPAPERPVAEMEITHVLDDRELPEGKLTMEVKAVAKGLVPRFERLFQFTPAGFRLTATDDSGPAVHRLDSEGDELAAATERTWLLTLMRDAAAGATGQFQFPQARLADLKVAYKRYEDADLVEVTPEIAMAGLNRGAWTAWQWVALGAVALVAAVVVPLRRRRQANGTELAPPYAPPASVSPFSTLQLLRAISADRQVQLSESDRGDLRSALEKVEASFFDRPSAEAAPPDLEALNREWVERANTRR